MMSSGMDDPRAARDRGELGLERDQVCAYPAIETREAFAEARCAARRADVGKTIEHRARECELCHGIPWMYRVRSEIPETLGSGEHLRNDLITGCNCQTP